MRILVALLAAMISVTQVAAECSVSSGPGTHALVELFTSEGCDSCPPADRWLSRFGAGGIEPARVIPLAFHVDYWDYLGWKDRFGDTRYSERQRALARAAGSSRVYTPQVFVAGRDFYRWRDEAALARTLEEVTRRPARASIRIDSGPLAGRKWVSTVSVDPAPGESRSDLATFVAVVENALATRVTAGENRGETLRHDHVVRRLSVTRNGESSGRFDSVIDIPSDWSVERLALVAFVQNVKTGEVLQALRVPACVK